MKHIHEMTGKAFFIKTNISFSLFFELVHRDFLERYAGSWLGGLWVFSGQILSSLLYYAIFHAYMATGENYPLYLFSGIACFTFFQSSVVRMASSLIDRRTILSRSPISISVFPVYILFSEGIIFLIYTVFCISLSYFTFGFHYRILFLLPVMVLIFLFNCGLGLLLSSVHVIFRDLKEAIVLFMPFLFWLTPVVWTVNKVPFFLQNIAILNPLSHILGIYRAALSGMTPDWLSMSYIILLILLIFLLHFFIAMRLGSAIRDSL